MTHVQIKIQAKSEAGPLFPELVDGTEQPCLGFGILEAGTTSGKTSCCVMTQDEHGKPIMVQFTGDMFLSMAAALKGAKQRFGDPWDGV